MFDSDCERLRRRFLKQPFDRKFTLLHMIIIRSLPGFPKYKKQSPFSDLNRYEHNPIIDVLGGSWI